MENVYYFLNTKTLVGYVDEDVYKYFPGQIINESNYKDIIINNETVYIDLEEVPSRFFVFKK
jgi:hypothetical protein